MPPPRKIAEVHQHEKLLIMILLIDVVYLYASTLLPIAVGENHYTKDSTNTVSHLTFVTYILIATFIQVRGGNTLITIIKKRQDQVIRVPKAVKVFRVLESLVI